MTQFSAAPSGCVRACVRILRLMLDILPELCNWDEPIALATVTSTWGSAPRRVGSHMAITADGRIAGSVSGGCVEGAVIEEGDEVLRTGRPKLLRFGVADETAFETVGLACGGSIEVFVRKLDPLDVHRIVQLARAHQACSDAIVIDGSSDAIGDRVHVSETGINALNARNSDFRHAACAPQRQWLLTELANRGLREGRSQRHDVPDDAGVAAVFVDVMLQQAQLVITGAVHIAQALAPLAQTMGFHVTLFDPRTAFASAERFPTVADLRMTHPRSEMDSFPFTPATALVTLTHEERFDDPAIVAALRSPAFYIGALGGRKTAARRRERLAALGFKNTDLDRIHGPIGLDIDAHSPEEIALATMAQIIAVRNGRAGGSRQ